MAGLTSAEAAERLAQLGPNEVQTARRTRLAGRVGRQLIDPLIILLWGALAVTLLVRDLTDAAVIAAVVIVNTTIGVVQEVRADRAVAALTTLSAPSATVIRDGVAMMVPTAEVVPDDLVALGAGDIVPADLRVTEAQRFQLDESALTGESVPVWRDEGDEIGSGTVVVTGRARGVVVRTGARSGLGRIAAAIAATRPGPTPLQKRLAGLGRLLGLAVVVLAGVVFAVGLLNGQPPLEMAITAVSLVVAAVPESLPAVVTVALALAARRMASHRAIPRRLQSVETLGSVTVVASDKTGTVTEGRMTVQRAVAASGPVYEVRGYGYEPTGVISPLADGLVPEPLLALARAGALCNDATTAENEEGWRAIGDPLEAALVTFAGRCGLDVGKERERWPRIGEEPFDQHTRRMTTTHSGPDGTRLTVCKGAPESVLTSAVLADVPAEALAAARDLAEGGLRVLALAAGSDTLAYVGLVGVGDPVRETAPAVADAFAQAGIRLLLVTGDHPGTASAIGGQLGIWRPGDDLHNGDLGPPDANEAGRVRVYARTQPEQKLDIVAALQQRGHVVAMTGDGVNDAPALRRADIGVAMGGGTEVARQAADLILVDDNLGTLTTAVRQGRRIYDNIRRFLLYGLSGGVAEVLVMLVGPGFGVALPLLPAQILWINLLTHGVPGVALAAEPSEQGVMQRPPRPPAESVLGGGLWRGILFASVLLGAASLGAGLLGSEGDRQSMIFVTLSLGQLGVALAVRAAGARFLANPGLLWAVAASVVLQFAAITVPFLRELLHTVFPTWTELAISVGLAALPGLIVHVTRRFVLRRA
jgi:Ca2+-transporting ATPase